jgi:redox-sensitive bicupin YhaK (pirin superfamily)
MSSNIRVRAHLERGKTKTGWLDSHHTFSFGRYHDPRYMGFRKLRVINEDYVTPGAGFGTHSHSDMEILSYVIEGSLAHRDSSGGEGVIHVGEWQRMTAGTGISHSEFNASKTEPVHFLQIWFLPESNGLVPGYEQKEFSATSKQGKLRLVASRDGGEGSLKIHQDVKAYNALLATGDSVSYDLAQGRHAWLQVVTGEISLNNTALKAGDGAAVSNESTLTLSAVSDAEVVLFNLG